MFCHGLPFPVLPRFFFLSGIRRQSLTASCEQLDNASELVGVSQRVTLIRIRILFVRVDSAFGRKITGGFCECFGYILGANTAGFPVNMSKLATDERNGIVVEWGRIISVTYTNKFVYWLCWWKSKSPSKLLIWWNFSAPLSVFAIPWTTLYIRGDCGSAGRVRCSKTGSNIAVSFGERPNPNCYQWGWWGPV